MTVTSQAPTLEQPRTTDIYAGDAALMYDDLARQDTSEIEALLTLLRNAGARSVLDLGCGSGRITLPVLAALPVTCVALDTSAELLALLADRLADTDAARCRIVRADAARHREPRPVDAAVMGTSTISLFDARARRELFATTLANLAPGGYFALTNFCWTPDWRAGVAAALRGASGARYELHETWLSGDRRHVTVRGLETGVVATSEPWNLRHEQVVAELTEAGFDVVATVPLHRDDAGCNTLIVAQAPRRSALWAPLLPAGVPPTPDLVLESCHGHRVVLGDGRTVLDGDSGLWNVPLGYGVPAIADAVHDAALRRSYLGQFRFAGAAATAAAEDLLAFTGADRYGRVIFSTSGGAANDACMKLVRHYQALAHPTADRPLVVGLQGSYHGLMYGSMQLSGEQLGQRLYRTDARHVRHLPPNDAERLVAAMADYGDRVAAVVVEPVQGTGTVPLEEEYLRTLLKLRDRHGFLVVADEVATGFGRTGPLFASALWPAPPDVLVLSKALTNGVCAASALVVSHDVARAFDRARQVFVHGETQAGTAVAAAAIRATLAEFRRRYGGPRPDTRIPHVDLAKALSALVRDLPWATGTRGRGMFWTVNLSDEEGAAPDSTRIMEIVARVRARGALVHNAPGGITLCPALGYTPTELTELLACLHDGIGSVLGGSR